MVTAWALIFQVFPSLLFLRSDVFPDWKCRGLAWVNDVDRSQCQPISYPLPLLYFSLLSTYHSLMFYIFHTGKTAGDFILVVHNSIPRLGRVGAEQIFAECMTADFRPQSPFLLFKRQGIYVSEWIPLWVSLWISESVDLSVINSLVASFHFFSPLA